jgi:hypothetical protein
MVTLTLSRERGRKGLEHDRGKVVGHRAERWTAAGFSQKIMRKQ